MEAGPRPADVEQARPSLAHLYALFGLPIPTITACQGPSQMTAAARAMKPLAHRLASSIGTQLVELAQAGGDVKIVTEDRYTSETTTFMSNFETDPTWQPFIQRGQRGPLSWIGVFGLAWTPFITTQILKRRVLSAVSKTEKARTEDTNRNRNALTWLETCASVVLLGPSTAALLGFPMEKTNVNGLHCETGPALVFEDGTELFAMNGVQVEPWLALTPAQEIDCHKIRDILNAEVRREFVRKVGVERLIQQLGGVVLDTDGEMYELVALDLGDGRTPRPYLKMKNPSVPGLYHVEGVPPVIRTVREAINWRASGDPKQTWTPEILT